MVVKQFEKCPNIYVPLFYVIKTAKHFSEMFCIIFYLKLSQSKNKIILPTFANTHYVSNQSKHRKCPPNYVPWPSNNRAFIIINVQFSNKRALFFTISTQVIDCENIKVVKFQYLRGISGVKEFLASRRQNFTIDGNLRLCASR